MLTALVVDDSRTDRERLANYLQQIGIEVMNVQSSEEALLKIQLSRPDIIFLDVVLPGQSGFELCRDLKTNGQTQSIPIIIYSTKSTEADQLWSSMLGADAHLSKPVDLKQLTETLQLVIPTLKAINHDTRS